LHPFFPWLKTATEHHHPPRILLEQPDSCNLATDPLAVPAQIAILVSNQLAVGTQVFFRYVELPD